MGNYNSSYTGEQIDAAVAASAFKGALVTRITSNVDVGTATYGAVQFNNVEYDRGGFADLGTYPTRLTIPAGVSMVKLATNIKLASSTFSTTILTIYKNGALFEGMPQQRLIQIDADLTMNQSSAVVPVVEGDYFEVRVYTAAGYDVVGGQNTSWFSIEVVE